MQPTRLQAFRFPEDHDQPHKIAFIINTANLTTERLGAYYRCGYCGIFQPRKPVKKVDKLITKNGKMNL